MAKKRSRNPALLAFGRHLAALRGARTRQQISNRITDLGASLNASTLFQYEAGTVWAPDVGVLWALSQIYQQPLALLIELLRANRSDTSLDVFTDNDLIRHASAASSTLTQESERDDTAAREIDRLRRELERHRAFAATTSEAAALLARAVVALERDSGAPSRRKGRSSGSS